MNIYTDTDKLPVGGNIAIATDKKSIVYTNDISHITIHFVFNEFFQPNIPPEQMEEYSKMLFSCIASISEAMVKENISECVVDIARNLRGNLYALVKDSSKKSNDITKCGKCENPFAAERRNKLLGRQNNPNTYKEARRKDRIMTEFLISKSILSNIIQNEIPAFIQADSPYDKVDIVYRNCDGQLAVGVGDTDPSKDLFDMRNSIPLANYRDFCNVRDLLKMEAVDGTIPLDDAAAIATNYIGSRDATIAAVMEERGCLEQFLGENNTSYIKNMDMNAPENVLLEECTSPEMGNNEYGITMIKM